MSSTQPSNDKEEHSSDWYLKRQPRTSPSFVSFGHLLYSGENQQIAAKKDLLSHLDQYITPNSMYIEVVYVSAPSETPHPHPHPTNGGDCLPGTLKIHSGASMNKTNFPLISEIIGESSPQFQVSDLLSFFILDSSGRTDVQTEGSTDTSNDNCTPLALRPRGKMGSWKPTAFEKCSPRTEINFNI